MAASTRLRVYIPNNSGTPRTITYPDQDMNWDYKADKTNILELDNTTVYTPSADYNPSTMKYVDDGLDTKSDKNYSLNVQTGTSYTVALSDSDAVVNMNNASSNTVTIPINLTVNFPIGTRIYFVQRGVGITTIQAAFGVTLNDVFEGSAVCSGQFEGVTLIKESTDSWIAVNK